MAGLVQLLRVRRTEGDPSGGVLAHVQSHRQLVGQEERRIDSRTRSWTDEEATRTVLQSQVCLLTERTGMLWF